MVDELDLHKLLGIVKTPLERLIVILLSDTGLRASEACDLRLNDIDLEKKILIVRKGKGDKRRRIGLNERVAEAIKQFLSCRKSQNEEYLLLNKEGKPLDRFGIRRKLRTLGKKAGIQVTPHALRRAFVTINHNKGRPLAHLQIACGHSDIETTRSYCMTTEDQVIEAMKSWS